MQLIAACELIQPDDTPTLVGLDNEQENNVFQDQTESGRILLGEEIEVLGTQSQQISSVVDSATDSEGGEDSNEEESETEEDEEQTEEEEDETGFEEDNENVNQNLLSNQPEQHIHTEQQSGENFRMYRGRPIDVATEDESEVSFLKLNK